MAISDDAIRAAIRAAAAQSRSQETNSGAATPEKSGVSSSAFSEPTFNQSDVDDFFSGSDDRITAGITQAIINGGVPDFPQGNPQTNFPTGSSDVGKGFTPASSGNFGGASQTPLSGESSFTQNTTKTEDFSYVDDYEDDDWGSEEDFYNLDNGGVVGDYSGAASATDTGVNYTTQEEYSYTTESLNKTEEVSTPPQGYFSFNGEVHPYQVYNAEFTTQVQFNAGETTEETCQSYSDLMDTFAEELRKQYGDFSRVFSFCVEDNALIINQVLFQPRMNIDAVRGIPLDLKEQIMAGQYAWLFNYKLLRKMKSLTHLGFDSPSFVVAKVRKDIGVSFNFSHEHLFSVCKNLMVLEIGRKTYTRQNYKEMNNPFEKDSRFEEVTNKFTGFTWGLTKKGAHTIKQLYANPDTSGLVKVLGTAVIGLGVGIAGAATGGGKVAKGGKKLIQGITNFAGQVKNNL